MKLRVAILRLKYVPIPSFLERTEKQKVINLCPLFYKRRSTGSQNLRQGKKEKKKKKRTVWKV